MEEGIIRDENFDEAFRFDVRKPDDWTKGGQHVGLPRHIVTVTHIETGLCAESGSERSQWKNKRIALESVLAQLKERAEQRSVQ